jgi:hypothetical protein
MPCGEDILDKDGRTLYVAFNVNCPRHFLHPSSLQDFLAQDPVPSRPLAAVFAPRTPTCHAWVRRKRLTACKEHARAHAHGHRRCALLRR